MDSRAPIIEFTNRPIPIIPAMKGSPFTPSISNTIENRINPIDPKNSHRHVLQRCPQYGQVISFELILFEHFGHALY
jgi:hypothetical protein